MRYKLQDLLLVVDSYKINIFKALPTLIYYPWGYRESLLPIYRKRSNFKLPPLRLERATRNMHNRKNSDAKGFLTLKPLK
jgi:hypothetical protein